MDQGYIRLWRKSLDSGLIRNHNVWIFWTWCLLKANHELNYKQVIGFQEVILQPGDFVFGRKKAAEETGLSEQNIRTCINFLKKTKNLTTKPTNKFSVISIINWGAYQYTKDESNQQTNQQVTSNQPASNHKQEPLNKENNTPLTPQGENVIDFSPTAEKIYQAYIKKICPKRKSKKRAVKNIKNWLDRGRKDSDLVDAFKNYSLSMSKDPQYRKDPANFYGINEDFAFDYLPENFDRSDNSKGFLGGAF